VFPMLFSMEAFSPLTEPQSAEAAATHTHEVVAQVVAKGTLIWSLSLHL
jgi:hypothetical protein